MEVRFKYHIEELAFWNLVVEAELSIDDSNGWQSWVVNILSISLCAGTDEMALRIQDVPSWLINALIDKARNEADKATANAFHEIVQ
jgi:hypothetical protein